jgi:serine/threonine-protein kinase
MDNNRVLSLSRGATTETVLPFTDLRGPAGVAVDGNGTVYVTDEENRVLSLAIGSSHQSVLPFIGLNYPHGVSVNNSGTVYVTDQANDRVVQVTPG